MFDLDKDDLKTLSNGDDFVAKYTDELTKLNDSDEFQSWMTYEEDQQMILNTEKKCLTMKAQKKVKMKNLKNE